LENSILSLYWCVSGHSYIIHKAIHPDDKTSHYEFREKLVRALCQSPVENDASTPGSAGRPVKETCVKHYLKQGDSRRDCVYCKAVHKKRSRTYRVCAACDLPLCFAKDSDCFVKFHHRGFRAQRSLIEKKYKVSNRKEICQPSLLPGRPVGTYKSTGRGRRKKKSWWLMCCNVFCWNTKIKANLLWYTISTCYLAHIVDMQEVLKL